MKNTFRLFLFSIALSFLHGCSPKDNADQHALQSISVIELNKVLTQNPKSGHLIDVRTDSEWESVHAAPAVHLPMDRVSEQALSQQSINKADTIYVICASGGRSSKVASQLRGQGFVNVINVEGGTNAWVGAGLPVEEAVAR